MKKIAAIMASVMLFTAFAFPAEIARAEGSDRVAATGTTYYVDSVGGNDDNTGTSEQTPWKSLNKVTATTFQPGDQILLKSGSVWNGEWLWPKGSGTEEAPIKIDKYGGDALPIVNGMGVDRGFNYSGAVHLRNQEYWEIRNLEVTNDDDFDVDIVMQRPNGDNSWRDQDKTRNGILLIVDGDQMEPGADGTMDHIYIENCYVHDVDGPNDWNDTFTGGIVYNVVGAHRPNTTFRDLRIANNTIRKVDLLAISGAIGDAGTWSTLDANNLWMTDVYIGHNYMEDIAQGGIDLCQVKNGTVEYNVVDGFLKRYPTFRPTVALYPWMCKDTVFQFNEVYNGPSTNADGSPYDMDTGLKNVVYQFNYSHNNPCGWMLYMGQNDNDIIRYNISDDGGDFIVKYFLMANPNPVYFINNVIMYDGSRTKFMHRDQFKSQTYFYNNVFYNKSTTTPTVWHDNPRYANNLGQIEFSHNCFYEASGQHSPNEPDDAYKVTADPKMIDPGQAPTVNSAGIVSGATIWDGYKLQADSPLIDAGVYIPQMGNLDFFQNQLYMGAAPDIGVHEYPQGDPVDPTNYALGATATSNSSHPNLTPDKAVDGVYDQSSRWAALNSDLPIWLNVDFGKEVTFNKLILTENIVTDWAGPRIEEFSLQVPSADGFDTVYTYTGEVGTSKAFTFNSVTSSSVRLLVTSLRPDTTAHGSGQTDPSIVELEVYNDPNVEPEPEPNVNFLLNAPVVASTGNPNFPANKINDGIITESSRWASVDATFPITLDFDLQQARTFNTLVISENIVPNWASERVTKLELQKEVNGTYTTFFVYNGTLGASKEITFDNCTASKLRLAITGLQPDTTKYGKGELCPSLREAELYYRN